MNSPISAKSTISSSFAFDFFRRQAQHRAVDVDVLASGQNRVEAGSERDQRADAAANFDAALVRLDEPVQHLQQRGLAGAVAADEAEAFAAPELEGDAVDRPELLRRAARSLPNCGRRDRPRCLRGRTRASCFRSRQNFFETLSTRTSTSSGMAHPSVSQPRDEMGQRQAVERSSRTPGV